MSNTAQKRTEKITTIVLILLLLVGLSVMLYPAASNWWNSKTQSRAIATYRKEVTELDDSDYEEILAKAHEYNEQLAQVDFPFVNYDEVSDYYEILDITGTGVMGFISIPQIRVELPIYHGTSESVLNIAVGHLQGSTLPVGGANTHAVISAHRGLPSARLFSDLDSLVEGDRFTVTVLKDVYTYEVDKISIVLPNEMDDLHIVPGADYVTLTTCTPYGVNTHRLLVRAHRVETLENGELVQSKILADATQIDSLLVVPFIAAPLLIALLVWWFFGASFAKKIMMSDFPHSDPLSVLYEDKTDDG